MKKIESLCSHLWEAEPSGPIMPGVLTVRAREKVTIPRDELEMNSGALNSASSNAMGQLLGSIAAQTKCRY